MFFFLKKDRLQDALKTSRSNLQEGVLKGGGRKKNSDNNYRSALMRAEKTNTSRWELTRFLLYFTQDVEEGRFHSVAVQCMFPEKKTRCHFQHQRSNKTHSTPAACKCTWGCRTDTLLGKFHTEQRLQMQRLEEWSPLVHGLVSFMQNNAILISTVLTFLCQAVFRLIKRLYLSGFWFY